MIYGNNKSQKGRKDVIVLIQNAHHNRGGMGLFGNAVLCCYIAIDIRELGIFLPMRKTGRHALRISSENV